MVSFGVLPLSLLVSFEALPLPLLAEDMLELDGDSACRLGEGCVSESGRMEQDVWSSFIFFQSIAA